MMGNRTYLHNIRATTGGATEYTLRMVDTDKTLRALARELYPDVTNVVFVTGKRDDLDVPWQPVDARLAVHGVTGADLVDDALFLRRTTEHTWRQRLWMVWTWLRLGLWWRWLWLRVVLWWQRRGARA